MVKYIFLNINITKMELKRGTVSSNKFMFLYVMVFIVRGQSWRSVFDGNLPDYYPCDSYFYLFCKGKD